MKKLLLFKMKSQRIMMILFSVFFFTIGIKAADNITLVVLTKGGTSVGYALDKKLVLTFTDSEMKITGDGIEVTYYLSDFDRYIYSSDYESGIKDIRTDEILPQFNGERMFFPFLKANSSVGIYTLGGIQVFKKMVLEDGEYLFPLSALNNGTYLVHVNGLTYKIVKK